MFKKIVATAIITSQLGLATGAWAASAAPTPEFNLLRTSIALSGMNLSNEDLQARLTNVVSTYEKTAQPDGQTDRIAQALVALNMYTPDQAHELAVDAQQATARVSADSKSQAEATQAASRELMALASKYPQGAQFSGCDLSYGEFVAGGFTMVIGGLLWATSASNVSGDISSNSPSYLPHDESVEHNGEIVTLAAAGVVLLGIVTRVFAQGCGGN